MIWLSSTNELEVRSLYFDIRNIDLHYHGDSVSGVVRGVLGDGAWEIWSEVYCGEQESVQLLPVWTDSGEVISVPEDIDDVELGKALQQAVNSYLQEQPPVGNSRDSQGCVPPLLAEDRPDRLAA